MIDIAKAIKDITRIANELSKRRYDTATELAEEISWSLTLIADALQNIHEHFYAESQRNQ